MVVTVFYTSTTFMYHFPKIWTHSLSLLLHQLHELADFVVVVRV